MNTLATAETLRSIEALADRWSAQRADRLRRRHLERADFDELAATGFLRLIVPVDLGGHWKSVAESSATIIQAVRSLARGDHSVALVASMHPAVLIYFMETPDPGDPHGEAWEEQRAQVFGTALDGHFWGTVTSEPGSGGDVMRTTARAQPVDAASGRYRITGEKHFASGTGIASYMITTAKPAGDEPPMGLFLDLRHQPWDGTAGARIIREWDGMGMKATQSHAVMLEGIEGEAFAWPSGVRAGAPGAGVLGLAMYSAVICSIVDQAMAEADRRLAGKSLRPYEDVAWSQAEVDHWMLTQAMDGLVRTIGEGHGTPGVAASALAAVKAKVGIASAAEATMSGICKAVGGGAFSASSPFASWYEDVRALGYLRPPWALAFDQLIAARNVPEET